MTATQQDRIANLVNVRDHARRELDQFRTTVRARAIAAHLDRQWDRDTLNGALAELGLPVYNPRYTMRLMVPVEATVSDVDEDEALAEARDLADRLEPAFSEAVESLGLPYTAQVWQPSVDDVTNAADPE